MFTSSTLGAHTRSKVMDSVSQTSNFECEDDNHIIITMLLLFTFTPPSTNVSFCLSCINNYSSISVLTQRDNNSFLDCIFYY